MKKLLAGAALLLSLQTGMAQSLEKMQWFNEPEQWEIKDKTLSLFVTPQSDYWRISHYGFTVDDAPFYYATIIRKSKFPPNPERSVQFSGKRTKRSVQKKGCTQHL